MARTDTFDFDTPVDRLGTSSEKWAMYEQRNILPAWLADMDFRSPPAVVEALHRRVDHGVFGYTGVTGDLIETVQSTLHSDYGWDIEEEWLVWLPGLVTGLNVACRAIGDRGDDVLTAVPVYPPFLTAPANMHRNLIRVPMIRDAGRWTFDLDRIEEAITLRTRLFLLCSPQNPVGRVFSRDELSELALICERNDIIICSDEIHCGLVLDKDKTHIPTAVLSPEIARRTITFMAPSKTFNLPGLGCSFAVISDADLRKRFRRAMAGIVPYVNALAYTAALAAYRDSKDWHLALIDYLRENRQLLERAVEDMPGVSMSHVEATYLAWIDMRSSGIKNPVKFFEQAGIGLGNGKAFGGPGFVRLTFGCPRSLLSEILEKMDSALRSKISDEESA